jgi:hypothetical protein
MSSLLVKKLDILYSFFLIKLFTLLCKWRFIYNSPISWGTDQAWVDSVWNLLGIEEDFSAIRDKYK